jgi:putative protease
MNKRIKPELLAPAGDLTMLRTAIKCGADAVYFGVEKMNLRALAKNFTSDNLKDIVDECHESNVKAHLTLNSIVFEGELKAVDEILQEALKAKVDMIICWDNAVIQKCREYGMPFCISTQASVSNSSAAMFYKSIGAKRIVLARECSLEMIKEIKLKADIEIETFVHGAMCIAVSGRCFLSHHLFGRSANKGECLQPCRREYSVYDNEEENKSLLIGADYILSPKDLCMVEFIDELIEAGVDSFKIEGRKRSPEYIQKVVSSYRQAIDFYYEGKLTPEVKKEFVNELEKVYNRGFSAGFYFDVPGAEEYTQIYGSRAKTQKQFIGKVLNYYKKSKVAHIRLDAGDLKSGDSIYIIGETTGVVELDINTFFKDEKPSDSAIQGDKITLNCEELVRERDQVYKIVKLRK